jgi:tetratricopeptide (TPR) repeat protein
MNIAVCTSLFCTISVTCLSGQQTTNTTRVPPGASTQTDALYTGVVMMADGTSVPGSVDIRIVCNGSESTVAHTTVNDDFQFQWMRAPRQSVPLAISSYAAPMTGAIGDASSAVRSSLADQYGYCHLRASLPGYRSSEINLDNYPAFDGTNVGVLWLRPVNSPEGNLVSALTLRAPKDARKLFDKGLQSLGSRDLPAAAGSFEKAVAMYPEYADAWLDLGKTQFDMGASDSATTSLQKAIALDPRLPGAWQVLGYIAFNQRRWTDAVAYLDHAEQLDPLNSPMPWFYSGVAFFELRKYEQAEKSIRTEIDMDPQFRMVRARYMLGIILLARHDTARASDVLRNYLAVSPDPRDVASVTAVLARLQNNNLN